MGKSGLSLLEVLVAALTLALTVGGVLYIFSTEKGVVSRSGRRMQAIEFARQKLEGLKNAVRPTMDESGEPLELQNWTGYEDLSGDFGTRFSGQRRYQVEDVVGIEPAVAYRKVTVEIKWLEPTGPASTGPSPTGPSPTTP